MAKIKSFEIFSVDLPLKRPFVHAAAKRLTSESLFLKCISEKGTVGFGESLPRKYVTGESRDDAYKILTDVLPFLIGKEFNSYEDLVFFLKQCNGKVPQDYLKAGLPQTAAWCAVDLSLLDTFSKEFKTNIIVSREPKSINKLRYSVVSSAPAKFSTLLKTRLLRIKHVKLKVDEFTKTKEISHVRKILGNSTDIRVDANMAWDKKKTYDNINEWSTYGVQSYEQPLKKANLTTISELTVDADVAIIADESFSDEESLKQIINTKSYSGINVRISKCGGLIASRLRSRQALAAGLSIQIGCQVGESSLLSAANIILALSMPQAKYLEGCFGKFLLKVDPARPTIQFGYAGKISADLQGAGLGVNIDENILRRFCNKSAAINKVKDN